jgi:hypothetical protein
MHGNEIGADVRRIAVERNVVACATKCCEPSKRVKLFSWLALISSGPISDAPLGRVTCFGREDGGEMPAVEILVIKCAKVAVHDARDFELVDYFGGPVVIHV